MILLSAAQPHVLSFNLTSHDRLYSSLLTYKKNINFTRKFPQTLQFPNLPKTIKKREYEWRLQNDYIIFPISLTEVSYVH